MNLPTGLTWKNIRRVTPGGAERVLWKFVDPWIRACTEPGDLAALGAHLRISMRTLRARRGHLGVPTTRKGRPRKVTPTQNQLETVMAVNSKGLKQAATDLGKSTATVAATVKRALTINEIIEGRCKRCKGVGVTPAYRGSSGVPSLGHHVCEECSGTGRVGP